MLGSIDVSGGGGDGRGGVNLNPARLGPFAPGPVAAAAIEAGLLPGEVRDLGRAVQVDPIKPKLKPPGTKRPETKV